MDINSPSVSSANNKPKLHLNLDKHGRWLACAILGLLVIIVAMLVVWKPWQQTVGANARTVSVTGDTTLRATPDEFVFSTSYENTNADKATAIKAAEAKSTELTTKLKVLGVADRQIKTDINGYGNTDNRQYLGIQAPTPDQTAGDYTYTVQLTVTLSSRAQAQKVQDYLITTSPGGAITPTSTFSESTRKQLESRARDAATKDARAKADQSARNLGFKIGIVKSVDDGSGFNDDIRPMLDSAGNASDKAIVSTPANLSVQPGEEELSYSVTVVYYIK